MSIYTPHVRQVILETLYAIDFYSQSAEDLLLGTAAVESDMGRYLYQLNGPALGIFQMEPATWEDHLHWLTGRRPDLALKWEPHNVNRLAWDLAYAALFARVHYLRVPKKLPRRDEFSSYTEYVYALGAYWKAFYNTPSGKGTVDAFVDAYWRHVGKYEKVWSPY